MLWIIWVEKNIMTLSNIQYNNNKKKHAPNYLVCPQYDYEEVLNNIFNTLWVRLDNLLYFQSKSKIKWKCQITIA